ncbi:hypothetical protein LPTSP4_27190 [Leptospira ryugenii]|uniref:Protease PrsW n=1 Tax=Leptospira ryugenii TaxID=1917863 RepID=A0A2P2E2T5_9LEPT|nr:PrsW family glutamic-type intramembrane protease [Leptospira ryugenii]GBF51187.1 hypothetical protein LPTSP4_27190 [Leptospira ryugenii]
MTTMALLTLAILPGFIVVQRYYAKDHLQKEPIVVILRSFFWGAALVIPVGIFESLIPMGESESITEIAIHNFIVIALSEELAKYLAIRFYSYKNDAFNEHFDGIVYGACVGGGFATFENIFYVLDHGFAVGVLRAFLSVPGHILWGAIVGHWIAKEKMENLSPWKALLVGVGISSFLHGGFDFVLQFESVSLYLAPVFVLSPLFIVRWYTKASLEKDHIILFPNDSFLPKPIVENNDPNSLLQKLMRTLLYSITIMFSIFGVFLTIVASIDYANQAEDFETWLFLIPMIAFGIAILSFRWAKKLSM